MISRRNLLAQIGGLALLPLVDGFSASTSAADNRPIGLQLYTIRSIFQSDPVGTLSEIARIGYREVEFGGGGYDALDPAMLRDSMERLGLRAPSAHVSYDALLNQFDEAVARMRTLGCDTVVLPYMSPEYRTREGWAEALPNFNRFAADLRSEGLGFAYHNHDFEFTIRPEGVSLFELLLRETDPALVGIELDLYWATHAGEDVAGLIDRLSDRLYAFHVKDMREDRSMAAVGEGTIDFASLLASPGSTRVGHLYVENDRAPAPYFLDITTSFNALRGLGL